ncbi:MAG: SRPBCC family protein [Nocardioidaceae bacterium]
MRSNLLQPRVVAVERLIPADAQRIFDVLADPAQHPVFDGSGSVRQAQEGNPERLSKGATFGMDMKLGRRYQIRNTVVEFDEPRRIAWRHFGGHRWRYLLSEAEGGTLVREEWDPTPVPRAYPVLALTGFPKRNAEGMAKTLERLQEHVTRS